MSASYFNLAHWRRSLREGHIEDAELRGGRDGLQGSPTDWPRAWRSAFPLGRMRESVAGIPCILRAAQCALSAMK